MDTMTEVNAERSLGTPTASLATLLMISVATGVKAQVLIDVHSVTVRSNGVGVPSELVLLDARQEGRRLGRTTADGVYHLNPPEQCARGDRVVASVDKPNRYFDPEPRDVEAHVVIEVERRTDGQTYTDGLRHTLTDVKDATPEAQLGFYSEVAARARRSQDAGSAYAAAVKAYLAAGDIVGVPNAVYFDLDQGQMVLSRAAADAVKDRVGRDELDVRAIERLTDEVYGTLVFKP